MCETSVNQVKSQTLTGVSEATQANLFVTVLPIVSLEISLNLKEHSEAHPYFVSLLLVGQVELGYSKP